jgi:hypothetical protein
MTNKLNKLNSTVAFNPFVIHKIFIRNFSKEIESSKSLIWVYNIISQSIIEEAPFANKSVCAKALGINRHTVANYLDQDKVLNHKWIFSSTPLNNQDLSKWLIKPIILDAIVGSGFEIAKGQYNTKPQRGSIN